MNLHTGTHIEFPLHMLEKGNNSNTENLNLLIGEAKVFDLTNIQEKISLDDIKTLNINENDFIIFKTRNSFTETFDYNFVYLTEDAAKYLAQQKIRGVGIDALGIERAQTGHPAHKIMLSNNIIILEGLRLKDVPEGVYELFCLPLKIANVEALPVRAILIN
jgi:arylformamidase